MGVDPREVTRPSPEELTRLSEPLSPEAARAAAAATAPLLREVLSLQVRLRAPAPAPWSWRPALAAFALAAALVALWLGLPVPPTPVAPPLAESPAPVAPPLAESPAPVAAPAPALAPPPVPAPASAPSLALAPAPRGPALGRLTLSADHQPISPTISAWGDGEARLLAHGSGGTVLALERGRIDLEVDPNGPDHAVSVVAGDVTVSVLGTIFAVTREGEAVSVEVTRGHVRVSEPGGTHDLLAGERWSNAPDSRSVARDYAELAARAAAGEHDEALWADLSAFEAAHADSPLASEAALLRLTQQVGARPAADLVGELDGWLARWPSAPGVDEAHWLRATLLREELGDCQSAARSYAVLAAGDGPRGEAARRWLAICAGR